MRGEKDRELLEDWELAVVDLRGKWEEFADLLECKGKTVLEECIQRTNEILPWFEEYFTERGDKVLHELQEKLDLLECESKTVLEECTRRTNEILPWFEGFLTEQGDKVLRRVQDKLETREEFMCKSCRAKPIRKIRRGVRPWGKGGCMAVRRI